MMMTSARPCGTWRRFNTAISFITNTNWQNYGALVRLVPQWYADAGSISIYYASRRQVPAKTRVFVDFVAEAFRRQRLAERFAGSIG
jgi:DNA-binding transcriptional LysR family regulator